MARAKQEADISRQKAACGKGNAQSCLDLGDLRRACQLKSQAACLALKEQNAAAEAAAEAQAEANAAAARAQRRANASVVSIQDISGSPGKYANSYVMIRFARGQRTSPTQGFFWDYDGDYADRIQVRIADDADEGTRREWLQAGHRQSTVKDLLAIVRGNSLLIVGLGMVVRDY